MSDEQHHPQRTKLQNRSIHLYFEMLADALNKSKNYKVVWVGSKKYVRKWTGDTVKEDIWRPIQFAEFGTTSTRDMNTIGPSIVYDHMNAFISGEFGLYIPFPDRFSQAERAAA